MRFEIRFATTENFTAHSKRDFIDEFQTLYEQYKKDVLAQALMIGKGTDKELPIRSQEDAKSLTQEINQEDFRLMGFSFPYNKDEMLIQLRVFLPDALEDVFKNEVSHGDKEIENHWVIRATNFIGRKLLKEQYDEIDKEVTKSRHQEHFNALKNRWAQNVFSSFASIMGPKLQEKYGPLQASFFVGEKRFSFPLSELLKGAQDVEVTVNVKSPSP